MPKKNRISRLVAGKKKLCNPPLTKKLLPEKCEAMSLIESAEGMIAAGLARESDVEAMIAADGAYTKPREEIDKALCEAYQAVLDGIMARLE